MCTASGSKEHIGKIVFIKENLDYTFGGFMGVLRAKETINPKLLYYFLKNKKFNDYLRESIYGANINNINNRILKNFKIPLLPLPIQNKITEELNNYQNIVNGCNQILDHYKPTIEIDPLWKLVSLEDISDKITDGTHKTPKYTDEGIPFLRVSDITKSNSSKKFISKQEHEELIKRCNPNKGDILYSKNGTIGVSKIIDWDYEFSIFVSLCLIKPNKEKVYPEYLGEILNTYYVYNQAKNFTKTGTVSNLHLVEIKKLKIPLPDLNTQKLICNDIKKQKELVDKNIQLKSLFESKIDNLIKTIWFS